MRTLDVPAHAGTAFDGQHLYQISGDFIQKVDPDTGRVVATIAAPEGGASGMAWAEGSLWVGQHRKRKIHQVDPQTGAILRSLDSNRFVTGVTWVDGELWHGTWESDQSEIRCIDPHSGEVLEQLDMPPGLIVSGLESNGSDTLFCGGGNSGKLRAVRRTPRGSLAKPQRQVFGESKEDRQGTNRVDSVTSTLIPHPKSCRAVPQRRARCMANNPRLALSVT
jgi:hypothetical protein